MNVDSASTSSSGPPPNQRKERGAIAAQACDTCRARKQKCDESRPKCGLCQRMKLECRYREPQPTKKDKTLVEILDRLKSLEGKVDRLPTSNSPVPTGFGPLQPSPTSQPSFTELDDSAPFSSSIFSAPPTRPSQQQSTASTPGSRPYRHASAAHKMLTWPAIKELLLQSQPSHIGDLKNLEKDGAAFLVEVQQGSASLSLEETLQVKPFVGMQSQATRNAGASSVTFPDLTREVMHRLATAYFDSFNLIYPFMDRQTFMSETLTRVHAEGFDGDADSVVALLIFALGELAIEGSRGTPIEFHDGRPSGVRGGTSLDKPPGIGLFNEARKRMGFVMTQCDLENVQLLALAALYYESCFRHLEFWRLSVSASLACQVLITCYPVDWKSARGDIVKRMYWHCALMETSLYLELDVAPTGIANLEAVVGLPIFTAPFCEQDHRGNQSSHFEAHYASLVALRRLCADIHRTVNDAMPNSDTQPSSDDKYIGPSTSSLMHLASQLRQWRSMLPREIQWAEDDPAGFPSPQPPGTGSAGFNSSIDPNLAANSERVLFTTDLDEDPIQYPYVYDVQVALLRTRYYYAKYMIYRPFIYKALHYPKAMTQEDAQGAAECLHACLKWPLALSPTARHKRLIPYLFCWSQNFLGILIIFYMTECNETLMAIREQLCGERFATEIGPTRDTMINWIKDLKSSDAIAAWCWHVLQSIYHLAD